MNEGDFWARGEKVQKYLCLDSGNMLLIIVNPPQSLEHDASVESEECLQVPGALTPPRLRPGAIVFLAPAAIRLPGRSQWPVAVRKMTQRSPGQSESGGCHPAVG